MSRETLMKAALYGIPIFLASFSDKLGDMLYNGNWPTWPPVVGCVLSGTVAACIGLRAFFDGSVEREKNANASAPPVLPVV